MTEKIVIAIDGPSGSGKSSVAKEVARHFGLEYLDTGAMYRALTWYCLETGLDLTDASALAAAAETFPYRQGTSPDEELLEVDGTDVREAIRQPRISEKVSAVASHPQVRRILIDLQRRFIAEAAAGIVAEGRDITTVVAPFADARILLTAREDVRLARRGLQLGGGLTGEQLAAQISERDKKDSKTTNFTQAAEGVTLIDSSDLDFEQTVDAVNRTVEQALGR